MVGAERGLLGLLDSDGRLGLDKSVPSLYIKVYKQGRITMGSCKYYLKAIFAKPLTTKQAKDIRGFMLEVSIAEQFWQDNRDNPPSKFWPKFRRMYPLATAYLNVQGINTVDGDNNNALAGHLETGWLDEVMEAVQNIQAGQTEIRYCAEVWHLASWESLANWFKSKYGAQSVSWASEEDLEESDPFDRF